SVNVEGNTAFSDEELKFAYEDLLGKEISLLDAQGAVERITELYRSNQYILSQAVLPSQSVNNGVLTIRVVEGFIANVVIQGDVKDGGAGRKIAESYAEGLTSKHPVKLSDMERYLLLMDDLP